VDGAEVVGEVLLAHREYGSWSGVTGGLDDSP
jgi:hypothetical protein